MRNFTFLTNNVDINKAPENFMEMFLYQAYLDDNINNVRVRDLRDIKKSLLAELVEFDEETPESHKTWKEKEIEEKNKEIKKIKSEIKEEIENYFTKEN